MVVSAPDRITLPNGTVLEVYPEQPLHTNAQRRRHAKLMLKLQRRASARAHDPGVNRATRRAYGIR